MASTSTTSSGGATAPSSISSSASQPKSTTASNDSQSLYLGANFAHNPQTPFSINYDEEVYLQLMAGEGTKKSKTATQIYREEWVRRALNPAISDPRGDPSPIDLECAENQRARDRF